jgi:hypothetical protein
LEGFGTDLGLGGAGLGAWGDDRRFRGFRDFQDFKDWERVDRGCKYVNSAVLGEF